MLLLAISKLLAIKHAKGQTSLLIDTPLPSHTHTSMNLSVPTGHIFYDDTQEKYPFICDDYCRHIRVLGVNSSPSGRNRISLPTAHGRICNRCQYCVEFYCSAIHLLPYICRSTTVIKKDKQTTHKSSLIAQKKKKAKLSCATIALERALAKGKRQ